MSEERDFESLTKEIEKLQKKLDQHRLFIGVLGIFILLLLILTFMNNPESFVLVAVIAVIVIPIALAANMLETRGI
ncbi:MAG: hypothetical protein ACFFEE_11465 [Candidatus Thorarchaeota archaeon]